MFTSQDILYISYLQWVDIAIKCHGDCESAPLCCRAHCLPLAPLPAPGTADPCPGHHSNCKTLPSPAPAEAVEHPGPCQCLCRLWETVPLFFWVTGCQQASKHKCWNFLRSSGDSPSSVLSPNRIQIMSSKQGQARRQIWVTDTILLFAWTVEEASVPGRLVSAGSVPWRRVLPQKVPQPSCKWCPGDLSYQSPDTQQHSLGGSWGSGTT